MAGKVPNKTIDAVDFTAGSSSGGGEYREDFS